MTAKLGGSDGTAPKNRLLGSEFRVQPIFEWRLPYRRLEASSRSLALEREQNRFIPSLGSADAPIRLSAKTRTVTLNNPGLLYSN